MQTTNNYLNMVTDYNVSTITNYYLNTVCDYHISEITNYYLSKIIIEQKFQSYLVVYYLNTILVRGFSLLIMNLLFNLLNYPS